MSLTSSDLNLHQGLGIPQDLLTAAGVHRVTDREARTLLNSRHRGDLSGLCYPNNDPVTGAVRTYRVRRDHPESEQGRSVAKYMSASGDPRRLYFAPGTRNLLTDSSASVVVVEAEKSVLAVTAAALRKGRRLLAVGTGGCWAWRGRIGKTVDALGARVDEMGPLPDLDQIDWSRRDVVIAFDANAARNDAVRAARRALAAELARRGAVVRIAELPVEDGVNGPDDYVGVHGHDALFDVFDGAAAADRHLRHNEHERRVESFVAIERAKREARRRLSDEDGPSFTLPALETLRHRLQQAPTTCRYRIEGLQPSGTRVLLAAQFKAGKTTLRDNLVRSLVDGTSFLGCHTVTPILGSVVIVDTEMDSRPGGQLDRWLQDQHISGDDRVIVEALRGRAAAFDIVDPKVRSQWASRWRAAGVEYVVLDCLRPILDALGLDEHREAGRFLVAFDSLLHEAGIKEALVIHHMGHSGERARGDSRLRDWPDAEWGLVRQDDDPSSARYFKAFGRDVNLGETAVEYEPGSRRLTVVGGSRRDALARTSLERVLGILDASQDWLSLRSIETSATAMGISRRAARETVSYGIRAGAIATQSGPRNARLHRRNVAQSSAPVRVSAPDDLRRTGDECASALVRRAPGDLEEQGRTYGALGQALLMTAPREAEASTASHPESGDERR